MKRTALCRPERWRTSSCSNQNPLDNIRNSRDISAVWMNGEEVVRASLAPKATSD